MSIRLTWSTPVSDKHSRKRKIFTYENKEISSQFTRPSSHIYTNIFTTVCYIYTEAKGILARKETNRDRNKRTVLWIDKSIDEQLKDFKQMSGTFRAQIQEIEKLRGVKEKKRIRAESGQRVT